MGGISMIQAVKCPHCNHDFEFEGNGIDALNVACGAASYEHPEEKYRGLRLFFRGYLPCSNDTSLQGVCLGWEDKSWAMEPRFFYAMAAGDVGLEYKPGDRFLLPSSLLTTETLQLSGMAPFIGAKHRAMALLKQAIDKALGPEHKE